MPRHVCGIVVKRIPDPVASKFDITKNRHVSAVNAPGAWSDRR